MRVTRHKRQALLFLAAILVPAAVLIGLATRLLYQDRELAAKRAADQSHIAVDQLRRELDSRLEAVKLKEINRLIRSLKPDNPAVIFTAKLEGDRVVLPWEGSASDESAALPSFASKASCWSSVRGTMPARQQRIAWRWPPPEVPRKWRRPNYCWHARSPRPANRMRHLGST